MTIKDLMNTSLMKNTALLAGESGIMQDITWFAQAASLAEGKYFPSGLLLLFTGQNSEDDWNAFMEYASDCHPSGILIFHTSQTIIEGSPYNFDFFNEKQIPLFAVSESYNKSIFIKRLSALLSSDFWMEQRIEDWLKDICYTSNIVFSESLSEEFGYTPDCRYFCTIVIPDKAENRRDLSLSQSLIHAKILLENYYKMNIPGKSSVLSFAEDCRLICFVGFDKKIASLSAIQQILKSAVTYMNQQKLCHAAWSFYSGMPADNLAEFANSYATAKQTFDLLQRLKVNDSLNSFLDWYVQITLLKEPPEILRQYTRNILGPLLDSPALLDTLYVYLQYNENLKIASEHLFIHVNTLKYRLNKISEYLGCDLENPDMRYRLKTAIIISRYLTNDAEVF
ncbi:MAG: helix-turn-helix domain-containing protein [Bariatricus sp.]